PGGHIAVTATRATQVENRATMIITVRDDGVGIPKEAQASIFEIFAEGDGGARRYGGTGLGLAIAKQLVELMGGTLTLDSEPGKGSTFAIRLTLQQAHEAVRSPDLLGHKLVVISSDNELAGMMETRLTAWRAEVQWVADSETALGELAQRRLAVGDPLHLGAPRGQPCLHHPGQLVVARDHDELVAEKIGRAHRLMRLLERQADGEGAALAW